MPEHYLPVLLQVLIALGFAGFVLVASVVMYSGEA